MSGALAKLPSGERALEPFESLRPLLLLSREYCSGTGRLRCVSNASKDDRIDDMTCGFAGLALMRLGDLLRLEEEVWLAGIDCDESHRCGCERIDVADVDGMAAACMMLLAVYAALAPTRGVFFIYRSTKRASCGSVPGGRYSHCWQTACLQGHIGHVCPDPSCCSLFAGYQTSCCLVWWLHSVPSLRLVRSS